MKRKLPVCDAVWHFLFCSILRKIPGQDLLDQFGVSLIKWDMQFKKHWTRGSGVRSRVRVIGENVRLDEPSEALECQAETSALG